MTKMCVCVCVFLRTVQMHFVLQVTFDDGDVYSWHKVRSALKF